jgi:hypothetical protein
MLAWPWLASGVSAHARDWPATAAAWLACACSGVPGSGVLAVGGFAAVSRAFCKWWVMGLGVGS